MPGTKGSKETMGADTHPRTQSGPAEQRSLGLPKAPALLARSQNEPVPGRSTDAPGITGQPALTPSKPPPTVDVPSPPGSKQPMEVGIAAEVLRRVNRTRQVVSLVSQVIIRSYEEVALHGEVCRYLVTFGGYLMAWVGLAEEKPEKIIRPVAHAGLEANFLEALRITWSNDLVDRSPTSRAIREQRPYVARNIPTDPRLERLRSEAQLHGYTATCALPVQFAGHGMGVLTIHSAEPDAFGSEEVSLLRELANDLAAGVIGLREKAQRQLLEEATGRAQARYHSIIESAHEGIFQCGPSGDLVLANPALVRLLGYSSQEEMLSVAPPNLATHLGAREFERIIGLTSQGKSVPPFQARARTRDGRGVWVALNMEVVQGLEGPIMLGFVQDMTDHRAERLANARLEAVVDAADDAIVGNDVNGNVTDWNGGATRLFGYERAEVLGRPIAEFLVPDDFLDDNARVQATVARGGRIPRFETMRVCKQGRRIHTSVTISPIRGDHGELVGSTTVEHDITQQHVSAAARRSKELEDAEVAKLKALEKIRKTFMSEASHELNTPLTPLRIHLESLSGSPDVNPEQRSHLVVIERNVLRLCNLVKDMLEASRLETGRFQLERTDFPLAVAAAEVVQSLGEQASKAGVTLRRGTVDRALVNADRNRVGQVLYNLVTNAISFTPEAGSITVDSTLEGAEAVVRIRDSGVGLTPDQIAQLFQPFSRPHEGTGRAPKGTGLGLFIAKGIIEQHGGRVWAESDGPGKGSCFSFSLPVAPLVPSPDDQSLRRAPAFLRTPGHAARK